MMAFTTIPLEPEKFSPLQKKIALWVGFVPAILFLILGCLSLDFGVAFGAFVLAVIWAGGVCVIVNAATRKRPAKP